MTSATEYPIVFSLPRSREDLQMGQNRFKELWKRPSEKTRRRRRAIRSATIEVMQDRPYFVSPLRQATMIVLHLRQIAVASFDGRRRCVERLARAGWPMPATPQGPGEEGVG